jgi:hypothetical protein
MNREGYKEISGAAIGNPHLGYLQCDGGPCGESTTPSNQSKGERSPSGGKNTGTPNLLQEGSRSLVQQAVPAALEEATSGSRESTPRGRNPPTSPPGRPEKGKEWDGPLQGPPVTPKPRVNLGSEPSTLSLPG